MYSVRRLIRLLGGPRHAQIALCSWRTRRGFGMKSGNGRGLNRVRRLCGESCSLGCVYFPARQEKMDQEVCLGCRCLANKQQHAEIQPSTVRMVSATTSGRVSSTPPPSSEMRLQGQQDCWLVHCKLDSRTSSMLLLCSPAQEVPDDHSCAAMARDACPGPGSF